MSDFLCKNVTYTYIELYMGSAEGVVCVFLFIVYPCHNYLLLSRYSYRDKQVFTKISCVFMSSRDKYV